MGLKNSVVFLFFVVAFFPGTGFAKQEDEKIIKIGVLAHRGVAKTKAMWQPTLNYLQERIPQNKFQMVLLTNEDVPRLVEQGRIDFLLTNPASYVVVEDEFGLSRIATIQKRGKSASYTVFGSVIFTKADRSDINALQDLRGKSYMGVHQNGFGGWWMAWREFKDAGIDPQQEFSRLRFSGFPQSKVVYAVLKGQADAGNVRTGILESLAAAGKIDLKDFKVLNPQRSIYFSDWHSTRLYPEWPLGVLKHVSYELSQQVALALFDMDRQHPAAQAAGISGWTIPLDYKPVHDLMKELQVGPYLPGDFDFGDVLMRYWQWIASVIVIMSILATLLTVFLRLNRKLESSNDKLHKEILERELLQDKLRYQAMHDSLTELPNRAYFNDFIHNSIGRCNEESKRFAVAIIDLDHFKEVNDRLGHQAGDRLLQQVAKRLYDTVRDSDVIARLGGDEFALIMEITKQEEAVNLAKRLLNSLSAPVQIDGKQLMIGASMGIAQFPTHGKDVDNLLRNADVAMYEAKRTGLHVMLYDKKFDDDYESRLNFQGELQEAFFEEDSFRVHYQPRIDVTNNKVVCLEAMVRWNHPTRGVIMPSEFINLVDELGLMDRLTITVVRKVLEDGKKWPGKRIGDMTVSVNVGAQALIVAGVPEKILSLLNTYNVPADKLEIEIGNWNHSTSLDTLIAAVEKLSRAGVNLTVDNYGETNIPLGYFDTMPIKGIKMDRNLIMDMLKNSAKEEIVSATIAMAERLEIWVSAAGVEDAETWQRLKEMGCRYGQGYYFTKAKPIEEILAWLQENHGVMEVRSAS